MRNLKKIIIGSRQSDLARIQAYFVADSLTKLKLKLAPEFYHRPSFGDLNLDMDLKETNSKGVFTSDFQNLLEEGFCDLVVHSWKDLPIEDNPKTQIFTLKEREDQRDLFFLKKSSLGKTRLTLLTSSPRREYHLNKHLNKFLPFKVDQFQFESIRGNIPTRFSKFLKSEADGFVVAKAAVDRLMSTKDLSGGKYFDEFKDIRTQISDVFSQCHWMVLPLSVFPTAAAQGALALEILKTHPLLEEIQKISDPLNYEAVMKERRTHKNYGGGCHQAMGFSSLTIAQGALFYSSGIHEGQEFQTEEFTPFKACNQKWSVDQIFSSTLLNEAPYVQRHINKDYDPKMAKVLDEIKNFTTEVVISRFEACPQELKALNSILWVAGVKTWQKMASQGFWVNGTLDGLGLQHKPDTSYLEPEKYFWFTNSSAKEDGIGDFKLISHYDISYNLDVETLGPLLKDKEVFFWSSGFCFESVLKLYPEIKEKKHFCGLGRTGETLKKYLPEENIFYCKNEKALVLVSF